jgi:hypothetical protein
MKNYQTFFIGFTAICIIAVCVATANAAIPALIPMRVVATKLAPKAKDLFAKTGKTVAKTSGGAAKVVWDNKGAIAVGTVATVALTNPEAAKAAVTGGTDIVKNAVSGTADVAYGAVTGGKTANANAVVPRANARPATFTGRRIIPTLLFYLFVTVLVIAAVRYCLHSVGLRRVLPLLVVGSLICFGATAEASMLSSFPDIQCGVSAPVLAKPVAHFIVLLVTVASIFL